MLASIRRGKSTPRVPRAANRNRPCAINAEPTPGIARSTPGRGSAHGGQRLLADNPGRCNCQPELWRGRAGRNASPAPNCSTITGSPPCTWTVLTPLLDQAAPAVPWALHWRGLARFAVGTRRGVPTLLLYLPILAGLLPPRERRFPHPSSGHWPEPNPATSGLVDPTRRSQ